MNTFSVRVCKYRKKKAMTRYPPTPETRMLIANLEGGRSIPPALCILINAGSLLATAPAMSGAESKKENRVAASRVKLRNNPAVIVMHERDKPGHRAIAWAVTMPRA